MDCSTKIGFVAKYRMGVDRCAGVIHPGLCIVHVRDTNISIEGSLKPQASAVQHACTSILCVCVKPIMSGSLM